MKDSSTESNNEIDLLEILGIVWKNVSFATRVVFIFFLRKLPWFVGTIMLTVLISFFIHRQLPTSYSSTLMVRMNTLNDEYAVSTTVAAKGGAPQLVNRPAISGFGNEYAVGYINEVGKLSKQSLVKALQLPDSTMAKQIKKLSAHWGVDLNLDRLVDKIDVDDVYAKTPKDTTKFRLITDYFFIRAEVFDNKVIPHISKGVQQLFVKNEYVQRYNQIRIEQNKSRIEELDLQIKRLDSLQRYDYFDVERNKSSKILNGQVLVRAESDRQLFHDELLLLNNRKVALEEDLLLNPYPITVIRDFEGWAVEQHPFLKSAKSVVLYTFLITLIAAIMWDNKRWLKEKILG